MKSQFLFALLVFLLHNLPVSGQKHVDLMLKLNQSNEQTSCFDVLLRSADHQDIQLAGQNYRLFYDARNLSLIKERITRDLDEETYSKIDLINTEDKNIGFISISIDGRILDNGVKKLSKNGDWVRTLNLCFDRKNDYPYDITWASKKKTFLFATAEVTMSEWLKDDEQQVLIPNETIDFSSLENHSVSSIDLDISSYPNPMTEFFTVAFGHSYTGQIMVKDVIGRQVALESLDNSKLVRFNTTSWVEGAYTIMILDEEGNLAANDNIIKVSH